MSLAYLVVFLFALAAGTGVGGVAGFLWFCGFAVAGCIVVSMMGSANTKETGAQQSEARSRADAQLSAWFDQCREKHRDALIVRYRQLVRQDAYGNIDLKAWQREMVSVAAAVRMPQNDPLRPWFETGLTALVQKWVKEEDSDGEGVAFSSSNPIEYEQWCAAELRRAGWSASTTKASGDQGLDIFAEKNGRKIAIQCKLYTKPVGNKAVQEAHTAAAFVNADTAIVVAPVDYTPSARELANKIGVLLLHHSQLATLDMLLLRRA